MSSPQHFDAVLDAAKAATVDAAATEPAAATYAPLPAQPTAGFQPDGTIAVYGNDGWTRLVPVGPSGINGGTAYAPESTVTAPSDLTNAQVPTTPTAGFQPDGTIAVYDDAAGWTRLVPLGPSGINGGTAYGPDPNAPTALHGGTFDLSNFV